MVLYARCKLLIFARTFWTVVPNNVNSNCFEAKLKLVIITKLQIKI
jgi:hypothetical protein